MFELNNNNQEEQYQKVFRMTDTISESWIWQFNEQGGNRNAHD
jgi:hypothetical protein